MSKKEFKSAVSGPRIVRGLGLGQNQAMEEDLTILAEFLDRGIKINSSMMRSDKAADPICSILAPEDKKFTISASAVKDSIEGRAIIQVGHNVEITGQTDNLKTLFEDEKGKVLLLNGQTPVFSPVRLRLILNKHTDLPKKNPMIKYLENKNLLLISPPPEIKEEPDLVKNFYDGDLIKFFNCVRILYPNHQSSEAFIQKQVDSLTSRLTANKIQHSVSLTSLTIISSAELSHSTFFRKRFSIKLREKLDSFKKLEKKVTSWRP